MKNKIRIILVVFLFTTVACQEPSNTIYEENATLIWTGEYEVDGCGFFVEIDSVQYKPQSESVVSPHFKERSRVNVTIQYLDLQYEIEYYCGDLPEAQKVGAIRVISLDENKN